MPKTSKHRYIELPTLEEDRRIVAAAKADPDAQPWTTQQLKNVVPGSIGRGRPKSANAKKLVSMRFSPYVLDYFRASGDGWQTRMNEVLAAYVRRRMK